MILKKNRVINFLIFIGVFLNIFFWDLKSVYISQINEVSNFLLSSLRFVLILPLLLILQKITKKEIISAVLLFLILVFHYIIIYLLHDVKLEFINIIYCFVVSLLFLTVVKFKKLIFFYIKKSYLLFFFIFLTVILINYLFYADATFQNWQACSIFNIKTFFFKEPSHFAYLAVSILLYFLLISRAKFFLFFLLILVNLSTTLIISLLLNFLFFFRKLIRFKYILLFIIFFISLVFFYKKECNERLIGVYQEISNLSNFVSDKYSLGENNNLTSGENNNLTSLVYKNNLLISLESIKNNIFGWGFNNYSKAFFYYSGSNLEELIKYYDTPLEYKILNYNDGRSNFFKITVEFGVFVFIFIYFILSFFFSKNISLEKKIIFMPPIITQLLSGSGYFNGGFILFVFLIYQELFVVKKRNV
jgi:hypothetical protein